MWEGKWAYTLNQDWADLDENTFLAILYRQVFWWDVVSGRINSPLTKAVASEKKEILFKLSISVWKVVV